MHDLNDVYVSEAHLEFFVFCSRMTCCDLSVRYTDCALRYIALRKVCIRSSILALRPGQCLCGRFHNIPVAYAI